MRNNSSKQIALGGMLGAAALVIMCLGGLIPIATYACPVLCAIICAFVFRFCGKRVAWAWYAVVCMLSLLIGPDKEAAGVFLFIGYYPILKPYFDRYRFGIFLKFLYFNCAIVMLYFCMIHLLGIASIVLEYEQLQVWSLLILLAFGNPIFILLDRVLQRVADMGR